jgi:hypothetical protein
MQKLRREIEEYNSKVQLMNTPRFLLKAEKREGKQHLSVIISVKTKQEAKNIVKNGLQILGDTHKAVEFLSVRPFDQCSKCQGFGHHLERCTKSTPSCRICAGPHQTPQHTCNTCNTVGKPCAHITPQCINCSGKHRASDPSCPVIVNLHQQYNLRQTQSEEPVNDTMIDE